MATKKKRLLRPRKRSSESSTNNEIDLRFNKKPDHTDTALDDDGDGDLELFTIRGSAAADSNELFSQAPLAALHFCDEPDDDAINSAKLENHVQTVEGCHTTTTAMVKLKDDSSDEVEVVDEQIAPRSPSPPPPPALIPIVPSSLPRSAAFRNASMLAAEIKQQQLLDLSASEQMSTSFSEFPVFVSPEREWILRVIMPNGQISRFPHNPDHCLVPVIEKLAMQEAVPMDRVLLSKTDGSPIEATDSPRSIGLNAVDFIRAVVVPGSAVKPTASQPSPHNEATVRVQMESSIREIKISLKSPLEELYTKVAKEFGISRHKLKVVFDGDVVSPGDTAEDLDIEGQELFDACIV